jgi:imidazoleglycerol phosphate dehydratase HisB
LGACIPEIPDKVSLASGASNVEVVSDPPNRDVYEAVGEVTAQVIGREVGEAFRQAANMLRNEAAKKGATFVSIDDLSSRAAWDFSGRTIVTMVGTAFRPKN